MLVQGTMAGVESQGGTPAMCTNDMLYLKPISLVWSCPDAGKMWDFSDCELPVCI